MAYKTKKTQNSKADRQVYEALKFIKGFVLSSKK